jgi:hypothetical protein
MTLMQRPVPLEGVEVGTIRRALNRGDWPQVLPAWLVTEIRSGRIGVTWDAIYLAFPAGVQKIEYDDWILRQPDGRITTCSAAVRVQLYELVS